MNPVESAGGSGGREIMCVWFVLWAVRIGSGNGGIMTPRRSRRTIFKLCIAVLAVALVSGACTSSEDSTNATSGAADQTGEGTDADADADEIPPLPLLEPQAPIVEPGTDLAVAGDSRLTGTVVLTGTAGEVATAAMSGGSASLSLPAGLTAGVYALTLTESDWPAFGSVRVADGPGLWIRAPGFVTADETPWVTVTSYGLPDELVAALEIEDLNLVTERMVPHPLLGLAPMPVAGGSVSGLPPGSSRWELPAGFSGRVRAVADSPDRIGDIDPETEFAFVSASIPIWRCDEPSGLRGVLGAPGVVRAVWTGDGIETAGVIVDDGRFSLTVRPGTVVVSATLLDGGSTAASPMVVRVRCGETVDLGSMEEPVDTGPAPGAYLGGLTFDDLLEYEATARGDIEFSHEGSVDCSIDGDALAISLTDFGSSDPFVYDLTVADFAGTGRYEGFFEILDVFGGGTADGTLTGELELGRVEEFDAIGGAFSGSIAGPLGDTAIELRFTCVVFGGLTAASAPFDGATGTAGLFAAPRRLPLIAQAAGGSGGEHCQQLFMLPGGSDRELAGMLNTVIEHWASGLMPALPRLSISTWGDVQALLEVQATQQLYGVDEGGIDAAGAVGARLLVSLRGGQVGDLWVATATVMDVEKAAVLFRLSQQGSSRGAVADSLVDRWTEMIGPLQRAGLCGEVEPKRADLEIGEEQDFTYEVTDLAGEAADDARVESLGAACGTFDPDGGPVDGVEFSTTFRGETGACTEDRTFVAKAPGTGGEVDTYDDAEQSTVSLTVADLWQFEITVDFQDGTAMVHSEWSGKFFIDEEDGQLIGAGNGTVRAEEPNAPCIILNFDAGRVEERIQLFTADGDFKVMVSGELAAGNEVSGIVLFIPRGFQMKLDARWSDPDCFPPGQQRNEPFAMMIVAPFTTHLAAFAQQPRGFEVNITAGGTRSVHRFTLATGGTVTIEVWRPQPPSQ